MTGSRFGYRPCCSSSASPDWRTPSCPIPRHPTPRRGPQTAIRTCRAPGPTRPSPRWSGRTATRATVLKPEEVEKATLDHPQLVRMRTEDIANTPATGLADRQGPAGGARLQRLLDRSRARRFGVVKGETRTAWITDPPSGKIPYSEAGRKLAHAGEAKLGYSDPESRPLPDRCLATGGRTGPPMINGLYNNHYQIVQTPGHVMIHTEMISHARVIPLRREHEHQPAAIHPLFGDSVGWWEGDKLVIETTNFNPYHEWQDHPAYLSGNARVTEKFSRVSDERAALRVHGR